jgi:hypothetical protein
MHVKPWVRLRIPEFREHAERAGLTGDAAIADRLGIHRISIWRLLRAESAPGNAFIAAALDAFPDANFPDFFEITRDDATGSRAA